MAEPEPDRCDATCRQRRGMTGREQTISPLAISPVLLARLDYVLEKVRGKDSEVVRP